MIDPRPSDAPAPASSGVPGQPTTPPPRRKRIKWEPPALMALVLLLGVWLVWNQKNSLTGVDPAPGTRTVELRVGNSRGVVEVSGTALQEQRYRVLLRNGYVGEPMTPAQFADLYGEQALRDVAHQGDNAVFRLFNITSWGNMAWVMLGLGGQLVFSARFLVQWITSERERKSVIPAAFWWLSLLGGITMFVYFVWRQDFVGVLGQSSGLVIYARNIRLIWKQRRRERQSHDALRAMEEARDAPFLPQGGSPRDP